MPRKPLEDEGKQDNDDPAQATIEGRGADEEEADELGDDPLEVDVKEERPLSAELEVTKQTNPNVKNKESASLPNEEIMNALQGVREDVGQICEMTSEEDKIVEAYSIAMLNLMRPLARAIPVDPSVLPRDLGEVERANVMPNGSLIVLHADGLMTSMVLGDRANRNVLIDVVRDVMPKINKMVAERKAELERRMGLLTSVTKELQGISDALASAVE